MKPGNQTKFMKVPVGQMLRAIANRGGPGPIKNALLDLAEAWSKGVVSSPRSELCMEINGQWVIPELYDPTPPRLKKVEPLPPTLEAQVKLDSLLDALNTGKLGLKGKKITKGEKDAVRKHFNRLALENSWELFLIPAIDEFLAQKHHVSGYTEKYVAWKIGEILAKLKMKAETY